MGWGWEEAQRGEGGRQEEEKQEVVVEKKDR